MNTTIRICAKRLKSFFTLSNVRMEWKLIIVFLFLIILPLSVLSYISYQNYSRSIEQNTVAYLDQISANMMGKLDDYIDDMEKISAIPSYITEIQRNLNQSNHYYEQRQQLESGGNSFPPEYDRMLSINQGIKRNISFINKIKRGANSVHIVDKYENNYDSITVGGVRSDIQESIRTWDQLARQSNGEAILISTKQFVNNMNHTQYAFTVVRRILDSSLSYVGLIAVDADINVIQNMASELDLVTKGQTFIIDQSGRVICDSDLKYITRDLSANPLVQRAVGTKGSFYENNNLVIYSTSPKTNWKIIITVPLEKLTETPLRIRNMNIVATVAISMFALFISIILSFALTRPLRAIMNLMKSVQSGNLNVSFRVKHRDEIGRLGNQFNLMIKRIKQLISDIYEMEQMKKRAELDRLQNQINPHFLYNTLESIRMTAEVNDDGETAEMISILGKMMRYGVDNKKEMVRIGQEIEHLLNYIELLNYRYPNRFRIDVSELHYWRNIEIVKLAFQPIVENAIYHGMDENQSLMHIDFRCQVTEDSLLIRIRDNGTGFHSDEADKLNRSFSIFGRMLDNEERTGIGLKNVSDRLKLHYGKPYGLVISSEIGKGTEVTVKIPHMQKEDNRS